jgi:aldose 1-epimerase
MNSQFQITEKNEDNLFHQVCIKNKITGEFICILPNLGARLNSVFLRFDDLLVPVLRELKDENLKSKDDIFNNAKLFPFANRVSKGRYTFQNRLYELPLNYKEEGNACHGLLYNERFNIISKNSFEEYAEVELVYESTNKIKGYPFCFKLSVIYKLKLNGEVIVTTTVLNLNDKEILFSDGWHPYYCLNKSIDDFTIEFNAIEKLELNKNNIPSGMVYKLNNYPFKRIDLKNKKLDALFRYSLSNQGNFINIIPHTEPYKLKIWHEAGMNKYNYLILYIPPDRKSIAVEPMTSSIDAFNNKDGLIILKPRESWSASFGFSIQKQ